MHLFKTIVLFAVVATSFSVSASPNLDAGIEVVHARDATVPFHARESSLMNGHRRMRRRATGCKSNLHTTTAQKDKQKHAKGDESGDKKKKKKSSKKSSKKDKSSSSSEKKKSSNNNDSDESDNSSSNGKDVVSKAKGLIGLSFGGECGDPDASDKYPNGNINFLNCGISKSNRNGKWSPPNVKLSQLRVISSSQAAQSNAFKACAKYKGIFDSAASQTGVPAVLLMSLAMQESTCNPSEKGGNGEIGMMQLTPDKCSGKNCWNASTNVLLGAQYFASQLKQFNGNVLEALGMYNGWTKGLTYNRATSHQYGCSAQNNLDYLNQMLNGWFQGKMGYELKVYNNLGSC